MPLDLRHRAIQGRGPAPRQRFLVIEENRGKNTDKMACVSREGKNEGLEVVETIGCGGGIQSLFNPENIENFTALRERDHHGGTSCRSAHRPFLASRAYLSSLSSSVSAGAYFLYQQYQPSLTRV
jgi:hypothetical protein